MEINNNLLIGSAFTDNPIGDESEGAAEKRGKSPEYGIDLFIG
jgi:hypothetical protein